MKTREQIAIAQEMIENLQDYVELSKAYKKMKRIENKEVIKEQLDTITNVIQSQVISL